MHWITHQENITILGMQESGKTTLTKEFLNTIPSTPRLIISPQMPMEHYGEYGNPITTVDEIVQGGAFVWTANKPDDLMMNRICKKVMTLKKMVMVVDDAHEFCKKQKMPKEWETLINSGRNRGITSIFISPSPNLLHNIILQSSQHLISFRFALESQIEYAKKNFFGDIAYLLLFPPARPAKFKPYVELGNHNYLHRSVKENFVTWTDENGKEVQLKTISDLKQNQGDAEFEEEEEEEEKLKTAAADDSKDAEFEEDLDEEKND